MKAIVFAQTGGPDVLAPSDVPKPAARPGMVLIKVHAIGVNFADVRFRQGLDVVKPKLPDTPGMEASGVVEAVGEGVTGVKPGMRVAAFTVKSYAEYCQAPESAIHCFNLMREGKLKLHIGKTLNLARAADAHRYLESRQSTGKLILLP